MGKYVFFRFSSLIRGVVGCFLGSLASFLGFRSDGVGDGIGIGVICLNYWKF